MKKALLIITLIILTTQSCAIFQISNNTEYLLPSEIEVPGWRLKFAPNNYTEKYINEYVKNPEDNRLFRLYGLKELSVAAYEKISDPSKQVTIEIFKMISAVNAFGILSIKRNEEYREINLCKDTFINIDTLLARKGHHFIKISGTGYPDSVADYEMFCKIICDKIKNTGDTLPAYLSLFSRKDEHSHLSYLIDGHPKLSELKKIFIRKIDVSGKTRNVFFAKRNTHYKALGELSNLLKNKEKQFILSGAGDLQIAFYKVTDNDFIFISVFKEWIIGILNSESIAEGETLINILHNNLKEHIRSNR